jgi:uncharacterized protein (TIGR00251 family)
MRLRAQPRAKRTEVVGMHGDALKLRVQAPPVDGKANAAIEGFLAEVLGVARRDVAVVIGHTGRDKTVEVRGLSLEQAREKLAAA